MKSSTGNVLRERGGEEVRVTNAELFFDLIYAFAVTQLSHHLLHDLSPVGAAETLLLWFAVWLGWQYTCWVTNWFDPDSLPIRLMLFGVMLLGLVMAAALPKAFHEHGLVFALAYVGIQAGRSAFVLWQLKAGDRLVANFKRILGWTCISAIFWIGGGLAHDETRIALWLIAVLCEYVAPMFGFALPGLGRSKTSDWTIDGGHLAERCQLFVIMALGESILITGGTLADSAAWNAPLIVAAIVSFVGSGAMWWMYFDTGSEHGSHVISHSDDPGRLGAYFHYLHVVIIAGVIVTAVGNELALAHPGGHVEAASLATLVGGPLLYLIGIAIYKKLVFGRVPLSHLVGMAGLLGLFPLALATDLLMVNGLTTVVLVAVAKWETLSRRRPVS